jgi:hypothetical protein
MPTIKRYQPKPTKVDKKSLTDPKKKKQEAATESKEGKKYKLTKKQKAFADKYLETNNATQSALETYDTKDYMT